MSSGRGWYSQQPIHNQNQHLCTPSNVVTRTHLKQLEKTKAVLGACKVGFGRNQERPHMEKLRGFNLFLLRRVSVKVD